MMHTIKGTLIISVMILTLSTCTSKPNSNENKQTDSTKTTGTAVNAPIKEGASSKTKFEKITNENVVKWLNEYGKANPENYLTIDTRLGSIEIELFDNTPLHRANFVMLVKRGYFDGTVFYRVIDNFMIQGGNSDEWETQEKKVKIGSYRIPYEMNAGHKHLKGALAMARDYTDNPDKESSAFSFYIVQRGPILPEGVDFIEREKGIKYSAAERKYYEEIGGSPTLDYEHTVFGKVVKGLEVVDKIASVECDDRDWPKDDIHVKMSVR